MTNTCVEGFVEFNSWQTKPTLWKCL